MSPKECSLAIEEAKEDACIEELNFKPELKVILSKRQDSSLSEEQHPVVIRGRMTISF